MRKKKWMILLILAAVIVLKGIFSPGVIPLTKWGETVVHTTESGYWPPDDSFADKLILRLYLSAAVPYGDYETFREHVMRFGENDPEFEVTVHVADSSVKEDRASGFVISSIEDMFSVYIADGKHDKASYWKTLPGFHSWLKGVHERLIRKES